MILYYKVFWIWIVTCISWIRWPYLGWWPYMHNRIWPINIMGHSLYIYMLIRMYLCIYVMYWLLWLLTHLAQKYEKPTVTIPHFYWIAFHSFVTCHWFLLFSSPSFSLFSFSISPPPLIITLLFIFFS